MASRLSRLNPGRPFAASLAMGLLLAACGGSVASPSRSSAARISAIASASASTAGGSPSPSPSAASSSPATSPTASVSHSNAPAPAPSTPSASPSPPSPPPARLSSSPAAARTAPAGGAVPSAATLRVTLADQGKSLSASIGTTVDVDLQAAPGMQNWVVTAPSPAILQPVVNPAATAIRGATLRAYKAIAPGTAVITATDRPACAPGRACPQFIQGFRVTIVVRG